MSTDPSSLRTDARRNYERLLQSAAAIFSVESAFIPLETIAKKAGVGIGTLYRHFPSRKALLEAVYSDKIAELTAQAHTLLQNAAPDKALATWLQTAIEYSAKHGAFNDLLSLTSEDKGSPIVSAGSDLLAKAQKTGTLRDDVTIFDLLQLVNNIATNGDSEAERQRTNRLLSVIMAGLTSKTPRS